jgi:hypothetical protein
MEPFPQATGVSAAQVPEKSCNLGLAGAEDKVMVGLVVWATKLYQTSFLEATPQPMVGIAVYVAPANVPIVFTQVPEEVNAIAPAHRSLAGAGSVTHILNVRAVANQEYWDPYRHGQNKYCQ